MGVNDAMNFEYFPFALTLRLPQDWVRCAYRTAEQAEHMTATRHHR